MRDVCSLVIAALGRVLSLHPPFFLSQKVVIIVTPCQCLLFSPALLSSGRNYLSWPRHTCSDNMAWTIAKFKRNPTSMLIIWLGQYFLHWPSICSLFKFLLSLRGGVSPLCASLISLPSPKPAMRQWPDVYCICLQYVYLFSEIWHFIATYWRAPHSHRRRGGHLSV